MAKIVIIYESRTGNTQKIAEGILEVIHGQNIDVTLRRSADVNEEELATASIIMLGAPTYNHDLYAPMKTFLFKLEKMDLKNKLGASFGAYGWSGESVRMMGDTMKHVCGMDIIEPGLKLTKAEINSNPTKIRQFAEEIISKL